MWLTFIIISTYADSNTTNPESRAAQTLTGKGVTFGYMTHTTVNSFDQVMKVGCSGSPPAPTSFGACNPNLGDTPCSTLLPMLCVQKVGNSRPCYPISSGTDATNGWIEGSMALTTPVSLLTFSVRADADAFCKKSFGSGWVMAEYHDGKYCSGFGGTNSYCTSTWGPSTPGYCINLGVDSFWGWANFPPPPTLPSTRFWVFSNNPQGHCFI